jgi:hypothetical protein
MNPDYQTLNDGCEGDSAGLAAALGDGFTVLYENCDDGGWGHHSYNAMFLTADGKHVAANCGGCSCHGSGDWEYVDSREEAIRRIPEQERPEDLK